MASLASGAPVRKTDTLVADPEFQELLQRSRSLTQKILHSIPDTHKSCINTQTLQLNSSENSKFEIMASNIGIPPAPIRRAVSEDFTLENSLTQMFEGLQLHRSLLNSVSPLLENKDKVKDLMSDIRDLTIQINKMLKMVQTETVVKPTPTPLALHLTGKYEVQVAAHLTLVQLQAFGEDVVRSLKSLDKSNDEENDS